MSLTVEFQAPWLGLGTEIWTRKAFPGPSKHSSQEAVEPQAGLDHTLHFWRPLKSDVLTVLWRTSSNAGLGRDLAFRLNVAVVLIALCTVLGCPWPLSPRLQGNGQIKINYYMNQWDTPGHSHFNSEKSGIGTGFRSFAHDQLKEWVFQGCKEGGKERGRRTSPGEASSYSWQPFGQGLCSPFPSEPGSATWSPGSDCWMSNVRSAILPGFPSQSTPGFFILSPSDIWGRVTLCWGWGQFQASQDVLQAPWPLPSYDNQKCLQMSPRVPRVGENHGSNRNLASKVLASQKGNRTGKCVVGSLKSPEA